MYGTEIGKFLLRKSALLSKFAHALPEPLQEFLLHSQSLVDLERIGLQTYTSGADISCMRIVITIALPLLIGLMAGCHSTSGSTSAAPNGQAGPAKPPADVMNATNAAPAKANLSAEVEAVKSAILPAYPSTTVGKAFEGTFADARWSTFETNKGVGVVEFTGTVPVEALQKAGFHPEFMQNRLFVEAQEKCASQAPAETTPCLEKVSRATSLPVQFQFVLSADKQTFELGHIDLEPFSTGVPIIRSATTWRIATRESALPQTSQILDFVYQ